LHLKNIISKNLILSYIDNIEKKELESCITPVSYHTGTRKSNSLRKALHKLTCLVFSAFAKNTDVQLRITSSYPILKINNSLKNMLS
jgi:hypothetical protein